MRLWSHTALVLHFFLAGGCDRLPHSICAEARIRLQSTYSYPLREAKIAVQRIIAASAASFSVRRCLCVGHFVWIDAFRVHGPSELVRKPCTILNPIDLVPIYPNRDFIYDQINLYTSCEHIIYVRTTLVHLSVRRGSAAPVTRTPSTHSRKLKLQYSGQSWHGLSMPIQSLRSPCHHMSSTSPQRLKLQSSCIVGTASAYAGSPRGSRHRMWGCGGYFHSTKHEKPKDYTCLVSRL
jgi:hypothetical protein